MISVITVLLTVAVGVISYIYFKRDQKGRFPPGPLSLPVVGSLLSLGKLPFKTFLEWGNTYPQMCTIGFGAKKAVLLNDVNIIRNTFNDPRFSGRADMPTLNLAAGGTHGILNSSGQEWLEQRRFTLRHLRDFGFGKKTMETLIMEDVNEFISQLKSMKGQPVSDVMKMFNLTVINSLWTIISGKRHSPNDDAIATILSFFTRVRESFTIIVLLLPSLAEWLPKLSGWNTIVELIRMERDHFQEEIKAHQNHVPEDGIPRDFMDSYLMEIQATTDPSSSFYKEQGINSLTAVTIDLFNAGTETTSTTLTWTILYLAKLQEVQKKLQTELDSVVGRSQQISVTDRPSLPYTQALIMEILRHSAIIVMTLFHTAIEDIPDFYGYSLPKGTIVTGNKFFVHHSSRYWDEPEEFRPERFLSEDGKSVTKCENFIPFSTGKRQCLGETLARDNIFLFLTNIMQRFSVKLTPESMNVPLHHKGGLSGESVDFTVIFEERL